MASPDVDLGEYVGSGDSWIRWRKVVGTLLGSFLLAATGGVVRVGQLIVRVNERLIGAAESFIQEWVLATFVAGGNVVRLGWRSAFLDAVDVVGPVAAPALVVIDILVIVVVARVAADRVI
jgi:hypothetical protein